MSEIEWLQQLKTGDMVFISMPYGQPPRKDRVSRVTAKQVFVRCNERYEQPYWKKDGFIVGLDRHSRSKLIMPTKEITERVDLEQLKVKARRIRDNISIPQTAPELLDFIAALSKFSKTGAE